MLRSLKIENFRCFKAFELQQLGRLNLFVGTNNSGKTSILEAVQLLNSQAAFDSLREVMLSRGEYILNDERSGSRELDVRHLFYGHEIDIGSNFSIISNTNIDKEKQEGITVSIEHTGQLSLFENLRELALAVEWRLDQNSESIKLPLSLEEGLPIGYLRRIRRDFDISKAKTQFVTSSSLTTEEMINLFNKVVLTDEEDFVIEALQTIEPKIERIAPGELRTRNPGLRDGFRVRLSNSEQPIPIGSMGDGIWRLLALTLSIVNARNGFLLVDEVDTGLHFSVMSDMWKLVWTAAKRLNVQVFATTHSNDCWTSLAAIANAENPSEEGITIQRIEKDKPHSVVFTERQIVIAAERGIEVR
ncbi:AAA family ATPase [Sphaerothrix gracilis]|uniref:AAA family ATPase n=1 Tax=Sphaerothrix gracilis TaxID=3151835 RepID=UPI0031FD402F